MTEDEYRSTDEAFALAGPQRRPGRELASARERAGISFETMAEGLRLPKRQLEALEADDYASLPPPTYVRGYIRAYAREVGLDGDDIVALYDAANGELQDPDLHPAMPTGSAAGSRGLPIGLAVIALVVVAGIGGWWWQGRPPADGGAPMTDTPAAGSAGQADAASSNGPESTGQGTPGASGEGTGPATVATASAPGDDSAPGERVTGAEDAAGGIATPTVPETDRATAQSPDSPATPEDDVAATGGAGATAETPADDTAGTETSRVATAAEGGAAQDGAGEGERTGAEPDAAAEPDGAADPDGAAEVAEGEQQEGADDGELAVRQHESPAATSDPAEAATPAAAVGPDLLELQVDGRSWMEVFDAGERELVYTLYLGSEPVRLRGWAPFDVFLGNSPAVTVTFNGETVAKSAFTRSDNTARFLVDGDGARRR